MPICSKAFSAQPLQRRFLTPYCCTSQLDFSTSCGLTWLVKSPADQDSYNNPEQPVVSMDAMGSPNTLVDDNIRGPSDIRVPVGWPAPMKNARKDFAATVVRRGETFSDQVVVVGGADDCGALDSVEIFDPVDGTWTDLPPLITARSDCAVAQRVSCT